MTGRRSMIVACVLACVGASIGAFWWLQGVEGPDVARTRTEIAPLLEAAATELAPIEEEVRSERLAEDSPMGPALPAAVARAELEKRGDKHSFYISFVTPEGVPLEEALPEDLDRVAPIVVATRERPDGELPDFELASARTYGLGSYASYGGPGSDGFLNMHQLPPAWLSVIAGGAVLESRPALGDQSDFVFVVSVADVMAHRGDYGASLRFEVVDGEGFAIWEDIYLQTTEGEVVRARGFEGRYSVFQDLEAGSYTVHVDVPRMPDYQRSIDLAPGEAGDLGTIVLLRPKRMISGTVRDPVGKPLSGVWISPKPTGSLDQIEILMTKEDGTFKLFGERTEELVFGGFDFAFQSVPVADTSRDYVELEIQLTYGALVSFVPEMAWESGERRMISVTEETEAGTWRPFMRDGRMFTRGEFQMRLTPGEYRIQNTPFTVGLTDITVTYP